MLSDPGGRQERLKAGEALQTSARSVTFNDDEFKATYVTQSQALARRSCGDVYGRLRRKSAGGICVGLPANSGLWTRAPFGIVCGALLSFSMANPAAAL